ncbi:Uncharacterised protein [Phocoenobacter uteri]|uniref:Uncharacterized protein n=1 Tax=Phocoenobacter uteri TaxID=146806 RepID=A0A379C8C4_9PAST|nr:DUF5339 family protein [Phocoenobacter uteri]MDG6882304.1 hypothetical protein [Phocoenobacter uteri]SUB58461.1 Uncharacterised protein [Phocoenobacter uteri]
MKKLVLALSFAGIAASASAEGLSAKCTEYFHKVETNLKALPVEQLEVAQKQYDENKAQLALLDEQTQDKTCTEALEQMKVSEESKEETTDNVKEEAK